MGNVHVEHVVRVWKRVAQGGDEELGYRADERGTERGEEVVVVWIALCHCEYAARGDKHAEFERWVEGEPFTQCEMVRYSFSGQRRPLPVVVVIGAVAKCVFEVVGYKVGAFEEEVDVAWGSALETVGRGHEGGVFRGAPVEFGDYFAAEFADCHLDLGVEVGEALGWVCAVLRGGVGV